LIHPRLLREILVYSMEKYEMPLPVYKKIIYEWAEETDIPREGEHILFTGGLYQLYPYIKYFTQILSVIDHFELTQKLQSWISFILKESSLKPVFKPPEKEKERVYNILKNIVDLLRKSNINIGYLYEKDMYNGAIFYDMGIMDEFKKIAKKIYENLSKYNDSIIITVDPHTTHILRTIIPRFLGSEPLKIKNYLEVINGGVLNVNSGNSSNPVVIHDACLYARNEGIIYQPRELLQRKGYKVIDPSRSKENTYCCGGPIESLFPKLSKRIASERFFELKSKSNLIATMCPICLSNLSAVKSREVNVKDLIELIT